MPPLLPPEILDLVADHLHDEPTTLKACCVLSKAWVSPTRKHLFACVELDAGVSTLKSWMKAFPDPSNSPARYVRDLSIGAHQFPPALSMDFHAGIRSFRHVTTLKLYTIWCDDSRISLAQLHGFSPVLKSLLLLYESAPPSEVFNLVCSFPSLEDLSLFSTADDEPDGEWTIPSTSPKLTGTLVLEMEGGIRPDVRRLLDLPGGLHFSSIWVSCLDRDAESMAGLVSECSDTLETLHIKYNPPDSGTPTAPLPFDLSNATRLEEIEFHWDKRTVQWFTETLKTVKSEYLLRITISVPFPANPIQATVHREWEDLDHVLVQLLTLRSIRLKFKYVWMMGCKDVDARVRVLFPELASRGIIDMEKR